MLTRVGSEFSLLSPAFADMTDVETLRPAAERRSLVAPAVGGRLVGDARVVRAIGELVDGIAATEEEIPAAWIADRPAAGLFGELQQGLALLNRDFDRFRLRLGLVCKSERCVAADGRTRHPHHARRARLVRPRPRRGRALGAARKAQAMDLADHRVAGDASEFGRDLAGGEPVRPQLLQQLDPLFRPAHRFLLGAQGLRQNPPLLSDAALDARPVRAAMN